MYEKYLIYYFTAYITKMLVSSTETTAANKIGSRLMFPSIHDAVVSAARSSSLAVCVYLNISLLFTTLTIRLHLISFRAMQCLIFWFPLSLQDLEKEAQTST